MYTYYNNFVICLILAYVLPIMASILPTLKLSFCPVQVIQWWRGWTQTHGADWLEG